MLDAQAELACLQQEMRACRRCLEAGYPIAPGAVFSGLAAAQVMIVGQAPGITESQAGCPFNGPSGRRLFDWLAGAGWEEEAFRATHYMTAVTKCFPGKAEKGDRAPTRAEQRLCAPFLDRELALVRPQVVIPVGGLAIRRFLGAVRLDEVVGALARDEQGRTILPLPHPSGASLWLNRPEHLARLEGALAILVRLRDEIGL